MSDMEENEGTARDVSVDSLDKGQPENGEFDRNKQNNDNSPRSGESGSVPETLNPAQNAEGNNSHGSGESGPVLKTPNGVENAEALPEKTDIEMTDVESNVEPQSSSHQPEEDLAPPSVPISGGDENLVKEDTEPLNGDEHHLVKPETEPLNGGDHHLVKPDTEHLNGHQLVKLDTEPSKDDDQDTEMLKDDDQLLVEADTETLKDDDQDTEMLKDDGQLLVKPDTETLKDDDQQLVKPDTEPLKDDDQLLVKPDTEMLKDDGQQLVKPDTELLKDDGQQLVKPDTELLKDDDQQLVEPDAEPLMDDGQLLVKDAEPLKDDNQLSVKPDTEPLKNEDQLLVKQDTEPLKDGEQLLTKPDTEPTADAKTEGHDLPQSNSDGCEDGDTVTNHPETAEPTDGVKSEASQVPKGKSGGAVGDTVTVCHDEPVTPHTASSDIKADTGSGEELKKKVDEKVVTTPKSNGNSNSKSLVLYNDTHMSEGNESGTEEEQSGFMEVLENFFKERSMEFKPPKFYGEGLNCLKLWRAVTRLGGYEKVTSNKLWRQVGETFRPPKTCTTVSWTFRGFYEKALLDYERYKFGTEPSVPISSQAEPVSNQASGSGRARRDAAARAMQGWHSQRNLGNGEVSDPIIKDKNAIPLQKREKQLKSIGSLKRKQPPYVEHVVKAARTKASKLQLDADVVDLGPPADWVKINVQKTKDCFEVYALVPGLLREEVRVQSDPAGRLVISGEPEHLDNPWGVTPFKKVVTLPSRIDPHQTSAVVTLHGQLFVRVPFEQSE